MAQPNGKKISFKLVCLGAVSVGKTSLSLQYVENQFVPTKATIAGTRGRCGLPEAAAGRQAPRAAGSFFSQRKAEKSRFLFVG